VSDIEPVEHFTEPGEDEAPAVFETPGFPAPRGAAERQREGLPASYRMRADAHYVDQLASPRGQKRGDPPQPAARPDAGPDAGIDRLHAHLAEHLATIQGAAALLAGDPSAVARQVSLDLIRLQAWRAAWLLQAHGLLAGGYQPRTRARRLGALLTQIRDGLAAECRLTRVGLDVRASDWNAAVDIDEHVVSAGVTGAILATLGLVGQPEWAMIRVTAVESQGALTSIDVMQEEIGVDADTRRRFFDASWSDRPGGWVSGVGAATARAAAALAGGDATLESAGRRGSTLRMTFVPVG
jgi:hypothetical protein